MSEDAETDLEQQAQVTRVRLVQFQRLSDEPMGITLQLTEDGRCVVVSFIPPSYIISKINDCFVLIIIRKIPKKMLCNEQNPPKYF